MPFIKSDLICRRIIELRRAQSNFQLVIITHDENFLQMLGKSEHADFYFRVERGPK
jgi:DNA repair protein RAD50